METIWKGKQTNKQATHVPVKKVNKQTNKQVGAACAEPMPEIEADIDIDAPDVNTPSLHPWVPALEQEATARAADQLEKVLWPPRNNGAGHKDPNLDLALQM